VALCKAIEANDLKEIDRLVEAGADVKAKGKGNMTPLLWAFPDNNLPRFKRLLEHGADPNVIIESEFNTRGEMRPGHSVTHMASKTRFAGYFEAVFENGGDVNLVETRKGVASETPIFKVIKWGGVDKKERLQFLIDKGADLNYLSGSGATPPVQATSWGGQYDIALMLLKAGADHAIYRPKSNSRLIHLLVGEKVRRGAIWTPQQRADYEELVAWLEARGESIETATADIARWKSWNAASGEYRRNIDAEIAERERREAQERKVGNDGNVDRGVQVE
jgi:ankyrin repeat protein